MNHDTLDQESISAALTTSWLGRPVHYFPETGSTNEVLQEMAVAGAPAGAMVITDYQHSGKGRLQRRWEAPAGSSLLLSVLFQPDWPVLQSGWLTMIAGLAAARAIRQQTGLAAGLKWPNDVVLPDGKEGWHKVGGLLLAAGIEGERLAYALLGIGLNVNIPAEQMPPTDFPATSLQIATGRVWPRLPLLVSLLAHLEPIYEAAGQGYAPQADWDALLVLRGRPVRVSGGAQLVEGIAEGTDEWGQLLVRDMTGQLHTIAAGDVTLRPE